MMGKGVCGGGRNKTCTTDVLLFSGYNSALLKTVFGERKGKIQDFSLWKERSY